MLRNSRRNYLIAGFVLIALIYILYNIFFVYAAYYNQIPRRVRHINKLLSILMVYAVGYYTFKKYEVKWILTVWKLVYFTVITMLILIGIYDWSWGPASNQVRNIAKTLHDLLISPILYTGIIIIYRTLSRLALTGSASQSTGD